MQQSKNNIAYFNKIVGEMLKDLRISKMDESINNFAREHDLDRGNLSKVERGLLSCRFATMWKITEAMGIKFSDFAQKLEEKLGDDFTLID